MVRLPTWHTVLSCKGSPSSRTHFSFMFRLASSSRRSHLAELLIPIFSIRVRLKDGQARCSLPCFGGCGTLPVTGGLAPLPILIAQNVLVCCVTGIPFSMFSRRSGNLMVTASVHSFIDAVRNALIVVPFGWCTDPAAALPYNSVCGPFSQSSPCGASLPSRDHCCWRWPSFSRRHWPAIRESGFITPDGLLPSTLGSRENQNSHLMSPSNRFRRAARQSAPACALMIGY